MEVNLRREKGVSVSRLVDKDVEWRVLSINVSPLRHHYMGERARRSMVSVIAYSLILSPSTSTASVESATLKLLTKAADRAHDLQAVHRNCVKSFSLPSIMLKVWLAGSCVLMSKDGGDG